MLAVDHARHTGQTGCGRSIHQRPVIMSMDDIGFLKAEAPRQT
jgi:hypothetical protein